MLTELARSFLAPLVATLIMAALMVITPDVGVTYAQGTWDCDNGTVVPDPTNYMALVDDCDALLQSRDILAGNATLTGARTTPSRSGRVSQSAARRIA